MSENRFLKGTLILTGTGLLSRFLGFFYRIFLSHTIGAQGVGTFQLVLPLQALVMALSTSGIQTAISRLVASRMALGQEKEARDFFFAGTFFSVGFSTLLAWFLHEHAPFFAVEILKEPRTVPLIRLIAFSFPFGALHTCISSYYFARKRTGIPAAIQLLEQLVRVGGCYLIYRIFLEQGREITPVIAAGGALLSEMASAFLSFFSIGIQFREGGSMMLSPRKLPSLYRVLFRISLPQTLNRVLLTLLGSMEVVLIPQRLRLSGLGMAEALSVYGVFTGMAMPLLLFPGALTNSAAVMLMPSISQLQALGKKSQIRQVVQRLFFFCSLMGVGCMLCFLIFGQFMGTFLFHSPTAGIYIRTLSFICPFLYLNTTLTSVLHGLGRTGLCLLHSVVSVSIRMGFVLLAIPLLGIRGYFYGILLAELVLSVLHLLALRRLLRYEV